MECWAIDCAARTVAKRRFDAPLDPEQQPPTEDGVHGDISDMIGSIEGWCIELTSQWTGVTDRVLGAAAPWLAGGKTFNVRALDVGTARSGRYIVLTDTIR